MSAQPNILLIITDQQRADHVGFGGNQILQTPNLDSVAEDGVVFDRAYVATPICMPNRSSILTGMLPSVHGTRFNGIALDPDINTFVRSLRGAGYRTGLVGKSHLQNIGENRDVAMRFSDPNSVQEAWHRGWEEGWDAWELQERHRHENVDIPRDFYGFDHVDLVVNHADYAGGHYYQWLVSQGIDPSEVCGPRKAAETTEEWWQIYKPQLAPELYPTSFVGTRSIEFIESTPDEEPFFLQCSFPDPHHPFTPPGKYWDMYDPAKVQLPDSFGDSHERSMPHLRSMISRRGEQRHRMAAWAPTEQQLRRATAAEYGAITMIDDTVGEILSALDQCGRGDNTVVIFTSDHGDMFGDHGILLKGALHYDACIRVPLVIRSPGKQPGRSKSIVGSIDLGETILDLAGVGGTYGTQGASLVPILDDPAGSIRDEILIEEDQMWPMGATENTPLRMRTVVTDTARLTRYQGSSHGELFDRTTDPDEMLNLWGLPEACDLQQELTEDLTQLMMNNANQTRRPTHMA